MNGVAACSWAGKKARRRLGRGYALDRGSRRNGAIGALRRGPLLQPSLSKRSYLTGDELKLFRLMASAAGQLTALGAVTGRGRQLRRPYSQWSLISRTASAKGPSRLRRIGGPPASAAPRCRNRISAIEQIKLTKGVTERNRMATAPL